MLNISGIEEGYVIDHIKAGSCMKIYDALNLEQYAGQVAIIKNARSGKYGKKDIIKIEGLVDLDLDLLGFIDDNITIDVIRSSKIIEKKQLSLPHRITGVAVCKNPRCITSIEQGLKHTFVLSDPDKHIYRCIYCEEKLEP